MIINIEFYKGKEVIVGKIIEILSKSLQDKIEYAFIHGSVGLNEILMYSDFDALVIIKDNVFNTPHLLRKTQKILKQTEHHMFKFDPLQHHGWFILKASELEKYPEHYLPIEVLLNAKTIFPKNEIQLNVNTFFCKEIVKDNFINLSNGIKHKINFKKGPNNLYHLKGLLSQFMLLPALYVQVRDGKGVFKKNSFDQARIDFTEREWAIMNEVSEIRLNWHYSINVFQRFLLTRTGRIRTFCARYMPIAIPNDIKSRLTDNFFRRMGSLVEAMERKVLKK